MANLFKNPLVLAETVVGSLLDLRSVILFKQPAGDLSSQLSDIGADSAAGISTQSAIDALIEHGALEELFTGIGVPYLSDINGFNMYGISYMSADVNISSDLCKHPIETGEVVTDNAIINPIKATVRINMPTALYSRIYADIEKYYINKDYIILQTKFAMYRNMVITGLPHKLENSSIDRPQIDLQLEQVLEVLPQYTNASDTGITADECANASDVDMEELGRKMGQEVSFIDVLGAQEGLL